MSEFNKKPVDEKKKSGGWPNGGPVTPAQEAGQTTGTPTNSQITAPVTPIRDMMVGGAAPAGPMGGMPAPNLPERGMMRDNMRAGGTSESMIDRAMDSMGGRPITRRITKEKLLEANRVLKRYQAGKKRLERRLKEDEKWWRGHAWDTMAERGNELDPKRPTKWLVNVIMGKHADMMEAYPEPVILPREQNDEPEAKQLTSILPVILEQNHFEDVYSMQAWEKNKHGTAAYAVYWDSSKLHGLGDVAIQGIDLINLFWEPGISDIQQSENVFLLSAQDRDQLKRKYPQLRDKDLSMDFSLAEYETEDKKRQTERAIVVDWYYHTYEQGQKILHYCKYCGTEVIYASEDDPAMQGRGWYDDGDFPFVLDVLFPQKNSPAGWGYIDLGRDAQEDIDLLDYAININARAGAIPRYFRKSDSAINLQEYMDFTNPIVNVEGGLGEADMLPIQHMPLDGIYVQHLNNKIEELKQTCGNQDVTNGITSGVTAASGIAAQMEAAGRTSRDGNKGTYRAYSKILEMVIERIRQFYDVPRTFRITGEGEGYHFTQFDNSGLVMQPNAPIAGQEMGWRKPVFDIQVSAQKQNAYSKMAQNELALQLLNAGVFNPQLADQSMMLLSMMDFNKKDELEQKVQQNSLLMQSLAMFQQMALQLASQVNPAMADQMANVILGGQNMQQLGSGAMPAQQMGGNGAPVQGGALNGEPGTINAAHMVKARERAANASQPT
jgi:hypothetical protein